MFILVKVDLELEDPVKLAITKYFKLKIQFHL